MERNKGLSIIARLSDYTVIDLETTGLDPSFDSIIELGAIKVRNGIVSETYQQLVNPMYPVDPFIEDLTGITNEMLADAPPIEAVIDRFVDFIGADTVIGHNVNFDINFVFDNLLAVSGKEFTNDYIDTMRLARKLLKELKHHRLNDLKDHYSIDIPTAHRSVADCLATNELYHYLWHDADNQGLDADALSKRNNGSRSSLRAADILATTEPDENNPIYGKTVVFTGTLERMIRRDAMQIVANIGGINGDNVTKETNLLVLGNGDYHCNLKDGKSSKRIKAETLISKGYDLQIISEDVFFDLIEQ